MKTAKRTLTIFITILILLLLLFLCGKIIFKTLFPVDHTTVITETCAEYNLDPYLLMAVIKAESNFVSDAQSHKDAIGLMQITEPTAEWIAEKINDASYSPAQLTSPETNIKFGSWYLSYLMGLYNNNELLALCAYNAGQGNVDAWLNNSNYSRNGSDLDTIPFEETEKYVTKIYQYKKMYMNLYPDLF